MQIKTTMRYYLTPVKSGYYLQKQKISFVEVVEEREPLYTVDRNVNWCSHYGKQYESSFKN